MILGWLEGLGSCQPLFVATERQMITELLQSGMTCLCTTGIFLVHMDIDRTIAVICSDVRVKLYFVISSLNIIIIKLIIHS